MRKLSQTNRRLQSRVGSDVIFDGEIGFEGELLVAGQIRGKLLAPQGFLSVEHLATVAGEIETQQSSVGGQLEGKVRCHKLCALLSGSTFKGALTAPCVEVAAGAVLHGELQMLNVEHDFQIMQMSPSELREHLLGSAMHVGKIPALQEKEEKKRAKKERKKWLLAKKNVS